MLDGATPLSLCGVLKKYFDEWRSEKEVNSPLNAEWMQKKRRFEFRGFRGFFGGTQESKFGRVPAEA